jgi:hypothetical protein
MDIPSLIEVPALFPEPLLADLPLLAEAPLLCDAPTEASCAPAGIARMRAAIAATSPTFAHLLLAIFLSSFFPTTLRNS